MNLDRELELLRSSGWRAGALALDYQRRGFRMEDKPDASPVTEADKASERLLVDAITAAYPDDGLLGEEGASRPAANGRKWIIDPIDGTRDFIRRNGLWSNLLALEIDGVVCAGTVTFPALKKQYYATKGGGAWLQDMSSGETEPVRLTPSTIAEPARAVVCFNQLNQALGRPLAEKALPFLSLFWAARCLGGALDAMLVCSGSAEVWIEPKAEPWDLAAISLIAKESGCVYYDYEGRDSIYTGRAVIMTPALEPAVRQYLGL